MSNLKGFTLIEVMIVIAIIGILASIAIPSYQEYKGEKQGENSLVLDSGIYCMDGEQGYYVKSEESFQTGSGKIINDFSVNDLLKCH